MNSWVKLGWLFLIFAALAGKAQEETEYVNAIRWARPFDVDRSFDLRELVTLSDGSAAMLGANDDGLFHFKFGTDGNYLGAEKILRSPSSLYGYIARGDSLFVVFAEQENEVQTISIHLYNLMASNAAEPLQTFEGSFRVGRKDIKSLVWSVSPNGHYWMVSQSAPFVKSQNARVNIHTFHVPTGDTSAYTLDFPYEGDDFEYLDGLVSDSGSVFLTGKTGIQLNSPFRRKFLLFSYAPRIKELREFDLNPQDLYLQQLEMKSSEYGVVAMAVYANDPFAEDKTNGYLLVKLNPTGERIKTKYVQPYTTTEVKQHQQEGSFVDKNIEDFFLQDIILAGEWFAVFEQRFLDQVCTTDPRTGIMNCTDQYNFLGLTVVNLSLPGQSTYIGRKQIDFNGPGPYVSNVTVPMNDRLLILYNDHFKNQGKNAERVMNNPNRSAIRASVISRAMEHVSWRLTEDRQSDFTFVSKVSCTTSDQGVYILASDGRQYRLGFLPFEPFLQ